MAITQQVSCRPQVLCSLESSPSHQSSRTGQQLQQGVPTHMHLYRPKSPVSPPKCACTQAYDSSTAHFIKHTLKIDTRQEETKAAQFCFLCGPNQSPHLGV